MSPTSGPEKTDDRTPHTNSKLGRVIDEYGLDELGNQMEEYWLADSEERYSLRELAAYVNQQLLRTVMQNAGFDPLDSEVENTYRLLTDDAVSPGMRTQACRRLERAGVAVDDLETDFVSRQAVHTYLTKVRGVTYMPDEGDPVENEATNIRRLKRRMTTMANGKLIQLRDADHITLGKFELLLDMRVLCEDCGAQYQVSDLLERKTCECAHDPD